MAEWILRMRPEKKGGVRYYLANPAGGGTKGTTWTYPGAIEFAVTSEVVPDGTPAPRRKILKTGQARYGQLCAIQGHPSR